MVISVWFWQRTVYVLTVFAVSVFMLIECTDSVCLHFLSDSVCAWSVFLFCVVRILMMFLFSFHCLSTDSACIVFTMLTSWWCLCSVYSECICSVCGFVIISGGADRETVQEGWSSEGGEEKSSGRNTGKWCTGQAGECSPIPPFTGPAAIFPKQHFLSKGTACSRWDCSLVVAIEAMDCRYILFDTYFLGHFT